MAKWIHLYPSRTQKLSTSAPMIVLKSKSRTSPSLFFLFKLKLLFTNQSYNDKVLIAGGLAQLGEHLPYKQRVGGSSPSFSTIFMPR